MRKKALASTILITIAACYSCNEMRTEAEYPLSTERPAIIQNTNTIEDTEQTITPIAKIKKPTENWVDPAQLFPVMIVGSDWGDVTLLDPDQGQYYTVPGYYDFLEWGDDGCSIWVQDVNGDLVLLDLKGQVITQQSLPVLDEVLPINSLHWQIQLSPDQKSVAFWTGDGEVLNQIGLYFLYERQDIYVISLEQPEKPLKISANGGGWIFAWSPDSESIAYSDFDENGRLQVYTTQRDGNNKRQITHFEQTSIAINDIEWSPDGQNIAFSVLSGEGWKVFYTSGAKKTAAEDLQGAYVLWWVDPETILIANESAGQTGKAFDLLNTTSGKTSPLAILDQFTFLEGTHEFRSPGEVAFFVPNGVTSDLVVYNLQTSALFRLPDINLSFTDIIIWSATPLSFPGKEACLSNEN
jgi:WD40 repeat protein